MKINQMNKEEAKEFSDFVKKCRIVELSLDSNLEYKKLKDKKNQKIKDTLYATGEYDIEE